MTFHPVRIGVLSDSHGELDPWVLTALKGVDHILHAGDVESTRTIPALQRIARVTHVAGNMDGYTRTNRTAVATCTGFSFYVIHDIERLDIDPKAAGMHAVIHGHTHRADISWENGVLYLNPGSVSRPRSGPGPSLADSCTRRLCTCRSEFSTMRHVGSIILF
jgi:putative phosphoesterase